MPTAALIAGGLGAAGSVGSAFIGSNAASRASGQQTNALLQALGIQQGDFQTALSAILPNLTLGRTAASGALSPLLKLLTPGPNMTSTLSQIPGFQFAQDWGQRAVENLGTTTGLGGNVLSAGAKYATGLAQQGYGGIVNALEQLFSTGGNIISSAGNAIGSTAGNFASTIGNTFGSLGGAGAAGTLGSANAWSTGLTGGLGSAGNAFLLSGLFNKLNPGGGGGGGIYGSGGVAPGWLGNNSGAYFGVNQ